MRILLPAIFIVMTFNGCSQTRSYDDAARECTSAYQNDISTIPIDSLEKVMTARESDLRDCFIGLEFPDFNLTSIDGTPYTLSDLRGKVILLNFWFIGCAPCVAEMPLLNQLKEEYQEQDFLLLTFSTDNKASIFSFKKNREMNFVIFENSKDIIENKFHLSYVYPTNIFIDKEGKIVEFKTGGALSEDKISLTKREFKAIIDRELKK
jgi:thiol-disulfide isomerase/thioredoxin